MGKQDTPEAKQQRKKFIDAARELGADVPEEHFDRALRQVGSATRKNEAKRPQEKKRSQNDR